MPSSADLCVKPVDATLRRGCTLVRICSLGQDHPRENAHETRRLWQTAWWRHQPPDPQPPAA